MAPKLKKKTTGKTKTKNILVCLVELEAFGNEVAKRKQVNALAGNTEESFRVMLCRYKKKGYVDFPNSQTVCLTDAGRDEALRKFGSAIGSVPKSTGSEDSPAQIMEVHVEGKSYDLIFDVLKDGRARTKESVKEAIGCTNKDSLREYLTGLRSCGVDIL